MWSTRTSPDPSATDGLGANPRRLPWLRVDERRDSRSRNRSFRANRTAGGRPVAHPSAARRQKSRLIVATRSNWPGCPEVVISRPSRCPTRRLRHCGTWSNREQTPRPMNSVKHRLSKFLLRHGPAIRWPAKVVGTLFSGALEFAARHRGSSGTVTGPPRYAQPQQALSDLVVLVHCLPSLELQRLKVGDVRQPDQLELEHSARGPRSPCPAAGRAWPSARRTRSTPMSPGPRAPVGSRAREPSDSRNRSKTVPCSFCIPFQAKPVGTVDLACRMRPKSAENFATA